MWTEVYMARGGETAKTIGQALTDAGILVKLNPVGKGAQSEGAPDSENDGGNCYKILVPHTEVKAAHMIIITSLQ
ncbi:MAG: hypothetical protein LBH54_00645 [Clostridiales bacterium]|jgi:hypothetical protein|nr:hypothetical protein [Clostridiales bacterium]